MNFNPKHYLKFIGFSLALASPVTLAGDWQPLPGEDLIRLPAPVMAKAIEQDFRESALAADIRTNEDTLGSLQGSLKSLKAAVNRADGAEKIELQHQFLEEKSAYLDAMEVRQALREDALKTRISVYNEVLTRLRRDSRRANDPVSREVRQAQLAARERMQRVADDLDELIYPAHGGEASQYNIEYAQNIDQIQALQAAIRNHKANQGMLIDGEEVSREAFVRSLLATAEADLALLNQEDEMLGYMARLVALDAQSLQMEVAYGDDADAEVIQDNARPAAVVSFFIDE